MHGCVVGALSEVGKSEEVVLSLDAGYDVVGLFHDPGDGGGWEDDLRAVELWYDEWFARFAILILLSATGAPTRFRIYLLPALFSGRSTL